MATFLEKPDPSSPIPLHFQLEQQIRAAVTDGTLPVGSVLPPEPELAVHAGVSRFTIRQAILPLVQDGLLERRRGKGTTVRASTRSELKRPFPGYSSILMPRSAQRSVRVLFKEDAPPPKEIASLLDVLPSQPILRVTRLVSGPDRPLYVDRLSLVPGAYDNINWETMEDPDLYRLLGRVVGSTITHAREGIAPAALPEPLLKPLGTKRGELSICIRRQTFAGELPVEVRETFLPGNRYEQSVRLSRDQLFGG